MRLADAIYRVPTHPAEIPNELHPATIISILMRQPLPISAKDLCRLTSATRPEICGDKKDLCEFT